ncbi:MAG: hypothetical protein ABI693_16470 [Bryobacteraceae bacterium]
MGDPEKEQMRQFRDVTPVEYALQFAEPIFVNPAAVDALTEREPR